VSSELDQYVAFFETHRARSGFNAAVKLVVETALQSPHFLFHVERFGTSEASAFEIASRLSFFLWNSGPDEALLDAAASGGLSTSEQIAAQFERMLGDPRTRSAIGGFHTGLLGLDPAVVPPKNATVYPNFSALLWGDMVNETVTFADYVIRKGDGRLATLLTAPYSFPEGELYELYGAPRGGTVGEPVSLDATQRAGILTHASVLTALANPETTSPVRRGVMIRRNLMCQQLPDPPNDAPTMVPEPTMEAQTTRDRVTAITSQSPTCMNCHGFINPVGFGFEHYDAVGRYRTTDNGGLVDASGVLTGTTDADGPFDGAPDLSRKLAQSADVQGCYAQQWLRFALAKDQLSAVRCQAMAIEKRFIESGSDIRGLLKAIVVSEAFRAAPKEAQP
jgi:hypothetical protein